MGTETQQHDRSEAARREASDVERLVMRLRRYNEWRRGADFEQPDPVEIGRDIDAAIDAIEQLDELRTAVIASLILLPCNNDGKRLLESAIGIGA